MRLTPWIAALGFMVPWMAWSQAPAYPAKPVRVVVPFAPGGVFSLLPRLMGARFQEATGQPFVVESRPGANGFIGSEVVARSAPDGYTIVLATHSTHVLSVYLYKDVPFDPVRDFTPLSAAAEPTQCLLVHSGLPFKTVSDLISFGRKNPGKLSYGSSGTGGGLHLMGVMFGLASGVEMVHVPYKGSAQAMQDVVGGNIEMAFGATANCQAAAATGRARLLAVMEQSRNRHFPSVPTMAESLPSYQKPPGFYGYFGPANLPPAILRRLGTELVRAVKAPEVSEKLDELSTIVIGNTPEEFAVMQKEALVTYATVIKLAGLKPE
jgi:tripartite-type tricarboxylate transporter receptor subunit TctC